MRQTLPLPPAFVRQTLVTFTLAFLVVAWTLGCVPMRYTSGPGAKGKVVDAGSRAPVPGAFVTMTRAQGTAAQTTTSKHGDFHVRGQHGWYLLNLFHPSSSKPILQPAVLTITGGSYFTFATNIAAGATLVNVGEVPLQPLPK